VIKILLHADNFIKFWYFMYIRIKYFDLYLILMIQYVLHYNNH